MRTSDTRIPFSHLFAAATLAVVLSATPSAAQKKYDPGASDTEIRIGQTVPFSGPASAYSSIGKTQAAYFKMINEQGGVNGRKINLIQYDDAYSPPKAVHGKFLGSENRVAPVAANNCGTCSRLSTPSTPEKLLSSFWQSKKHFISRLVKNDIQEMVAIDQPQEWSKAKQTTRCSL